MRSAKVTRMQRHRHHEDFLAAWGAPGDDLAFGPAAGAARDVSDWVVFDSALVAQPTGVHRAMEERIREAIALKFAPRESVELLEREVSVLRYEVKRLRAHAAEKEEVLSGAIPSLLDRMEKLHAYLEGTIAAARRTVKPCVWVPISTFAPEPYRVDESPIVAVVSPVGDEFEAGLFDVNVYASGDTQSEAIANLKSYLLDLVDHFLETPDENLGPEPLMQKTFLLKKIKRE